MFNSKKKNKSPKFFNFDNESEDDDENLINKNLNFSNENSLTQKKIDWTSKMNPVRNQGHCGSCWAFAVIGAIEGNYNIKFGNSPRFSEQQLVDCDYSSKGCQGGSYINGSNYIIDKGIAFYNEYEYVSGESSKTETCLAPTLTMNKILEDYDYCIETQNCTREKHRSLLARGPIMVSIDGDGRKDPTEASSIFQHYTKGVLDSPCKTNNHAVIMIGVDFDEKGEYFVARNSWGENWGEKGNFRFRTRHSDKTCFLESRGILPIVKKTSNPVPEPRPKNPNCIKLYSECDFNGQVNVICENVAKVENFPKISGYSMEKFKSVTIFKKPDCEGEFVEVDESNVCLVNNQLKDDIKSIIIDETLPPSGCVWLYDNYCLSGNRVEICENVSDLNDKKYNFGNKTSSIRFGPEDNSIIIYLNKNFEGNNANIIGVNSLKNSWMDKDIESIKIQK